MPRRTKGTDMLTDAVVQARDLIVERTQQMTKVYQPGTFMTRKVDARTMDRYLLGVTAEQMAEIANRNPEQAEQYASRINTLESRLASRAPMPAADAYEPDLGE